jgi:hypothetical protein
LIERGKSLIREEVEMTKLLSNKTIFLMYLSIFFIIGTFAGNTVSAGVVRVVPVQATILDETVIVGEAVTSEGETRNESAFPANPESYLPMPIPRTPENVGEIVVAPGENKFVIYKPDTGEEVIAETFSELNAAFGLTSTATSLGRPGDIEPEDDITPINFSNLSFISNPSPYPRRVNGKLFFSKPGGDNFVCSATMIRRNFAITAGHCVHEGRGGT